MKSKGLISRILQARDQKVWKFFLEEAQSQKKTSKDKQRIGTPLSFLNRGRVLDSAVLRHLPIKLSQDVNVKYQRCGIFRMRLKFKLRFRNSSPGSRARKGRSRRSHQSGLPAGRSATVEPAPWSPKSRHPGEGEQPDCGAPAQSGGAPPSQPLFSLTALLQESAEGLAWGRLSGGCQRSLGPQGNPRDSGFRTQELQGSPDLVWTTAPPTYRSIPSLGPAASPSEKCARHPSLSRSVLSPTV